jgi:hypothetical protein
MNPSCPPPRPRGRQTRGVALALSLALHVGVLVVLLTAQTPPAPDEAPLEIEIIAETESPLTTPAPATADEGPLAPPRPREPRTPSKSRRTEEGRAEVVEPAPLAPQSPAGGTPGLLRMRPVELTPSFESLDRLTREGAIAAPEAPPTAANPRGPALSERIAEAVRREAARDNVESGRVHPQLYDYMPRAGARCRSPRTAGRSCSCDTGSGRAAHHPVVAHTAGLVTFRMEQHERSLDVPKGTHHVVDIQRQEKNRVGGLALKSRSKPRDRHSQLFSSRLLRHLTIRDHPIQDSGGLGARRGSGGGTAYNRRR